MTDAIAARGTPALIAARPSQHLRVLGGRRRATEAGVAFRRIAVAVAEIVGAVAPPSTQEQRLDRKRLSRVAVGYACANMRRRVPPAARTSSRLWSAPVSAAPYHLAAALAWTSLPTDAVRGGARTRAGGRSSASTPMGSAAERAPSSRSASTRVVASAAAVRQPVSKHPRCALAEGCGSLRSAPVQLVHGAQKRAAALLAPRGGASSRRVSANVLSSVEWLRLLTEEAGWRAGAARPGTRCAVLAAVGRLRPLRAREPRSGGRRCGPCTFLLARRSRGSLSRLPRRHVGRVKRATSRARLSLLGDLRRLPRAASPTPLPPRHRWRRRRARPAIPACRSSSGRRSSKRKRPIRLLVAPRRRRRARGRRRARRAALLERTPAACELAP